MPGKDKKYRGKVKGVIFDLSGTIIDHGCFGHINPFIETFKSRHIIITENDIRKDTGLSLTHHITALCKTKKVKKPWLEKYGKQITIDDINEIKSEIEEKMIANIDQHHNVINKVVKTLKVIRDLGIKVVLTTEYNLNIADLLFYKIKKAGGKADAFISLSDIPNIDEARPYPWMCYRALLELKEYPLCSFVKVGDTFYDIQEGINAGMWTVGVAKTGNLLGMTEKTLKEKGQKKIEKRVNKIYHIMKTAGANYVVDSVHDIVWVIDEINNYLKKGSSPC